MGCPCSCWERWWAFWLLRNMTAGASSYSISLPPTLFFLKDSPGFSQPKSSDSEKAFLCQGIHGGCAPATVPIGCMCLFSPQERKGTFYGPTNHLPRGQDLSSVAWEEEKLWQKLTGDQEAKGKPFNSNSLPGSDMVMTLLAPLSFLSWPPGNKSSPVLSVLSHPSEVREQEPQS